MSAIAGFTQDLTALLDCNKMGTTQLSLDEGNYLKASLLVRGTAQFIASVALMVVAQAVLFVRKEDQHLSAFINDQKENIQFTYAVLGHVGMSFISPQETVEAVQELKTLALSACQVYKA